MSDTGGDLREAGRRLLRGYDEHDLLTFASAIAFQSAFAIIPLALFGLGLLGGLGLEEQWTREWSATVREATSPDAFRVIDDTVRRVLEERRTFWMTAGGLLAVWEISGATRAVMDVFDRIYGASRRRPFLERLRVSLALGLSVTVLLLAAAACLILGDDALGAVGIGSSPVALLRYPAAAGLLLLVVGVLLRFAPVDHQPVHWVSFGSVLVVAAWLLTSLALGFYLREIANYGSVFGALATVWIVLTFLYFSAAAFLTGVEVDAQVRAQAAD